MNIDPGQINQLLNNIQFPVGKSNLVQMARQHGANDQIVSMLDRLPDKTFNSPQDLMNSFGGRMGNMGNMGKQRGMDA